MILCSNFQLQFLERDTRTVNLHPTNKTPSFCPTWLKCLCTQDFLRQESEKASSLCTWPRPPLIPLEGQLSPSVVRVSGPSIKGDVSWEPMRQHPPMVKSSSRFQVVRCQSYHVLRLQNNLHLKQHVDGKLCAMRVLHFAAWLYARLFMPLSSYAAWGEQLPTTQKDQKADPWQDQGSYSPTLYCQACQSPWWVAVWSSGLLRGYI